MDHESDFREYLSNRAIIIGKCVDLGKDYITLIATN